jgi:PKD repeat protein
MRITIFSILLLLGIFSFGQSVCDTIDVRFGSTLNQNNCQSIVSFTDSSIVTKNHTITAWQWDFGDGTRKSVLQNPQHTYTSGGTFEVTLIVYSTNRCQDSIIKEVIIPGPQPEFVFARQHDRIRHDTAYLCSGEKITLVNFSSGNPIEPSYLMLWGDGTVSHAGNIGDTLYHTYKEAGTYELYLIMEDVTPSNLRCSRIFPDTNSNLVYPRKITVIVHPRPAATITVGTSPTYQDHPTAFTANLDAEYIRILWNMGDGTTYNTNNINDNTIIHKFQKRGNYLVVLTPEYDNIPRCWARDTFNIQVLDASLNSIIDPAIGLEIFPNPANIEVHLFSKEGVTIDAIEMIDILGKNYTPTLTKQGNKVMVDVSPLAAGNYVMRVATSKGTVTKKVQIKRD